MMRMNKKVGLLLASLLIVSIGVYFAVVPQQGKGTEINYLEADLLVYSSLSEVKEASDLIIVGRVTGAEFWRLVLDEPQFAPLPMTDFTVKIEQVILGDTEGLTSITVEMTGGTLEDETWVIRGNPLMKVSNRNVLFLRRVEKGRYILSGGPTGRYIIEKGRVYSLGEKYADAEIYTKNLKTNGMLLRDFVNEIKATN